LYGPTKVLASSRRQVLPPLEEVWVPLSTEATYWRALGIRSEDSVNFIVDECTFFFKVGKRSSCSDSFWRKDITKGSFYAFLGESSSRRENN
jgi:hypothetical protein